MLAQIKLYFIGAVAGLFALLGVYAKYQSSQKEKHKKESEMLKKDVNELVEKEKVSSSISDINKKYREKSNEDESKVFDRNSGNFSDSGLLDD